MKKVVRRVAVAPAPKTAATSGSFVRYLKKQVEIAVSKIGTEKTSHKRAEAEGMILSDCPPLADVSRWFSTGFVGLDWLISSGRGFPMGRAIEIWGGEGSGKSAVAQFISAEFQRAFNDGVVTYKDAEQSLDEMHMRGYDFDPDRYISFTPPWMEAYVDALYAELQCARPSKSFPAPPPILSIWDSVPQAPPRAEIEEASSTQSNVGLQPRIMSKCCRKIVRPLSELSVGLIFINQVRAKIGVMYGDPVGRPCGHALDHACSTIIKLTRGKTLKIERRGRKVRTGYILKAFTSKSRLAPPLREVPIVLSFARGPDPAQSAYLLAKDLKALAPAGEHGSKYPGVVETAFKLPEWRSVFMENRKAIEADLLVRLTEAYAVNDDAPHDDSSEE